MDPEELKSLDSNGGAEERSENNSSNSDIVHVEKEEIAEVIEEAAVVEQRLEQQAAEEREILEAATALTTAPLAVITPSEEEIPPSPFTQLEPLKVDITVKGVSEKEPPAAPEESKEEIQVTPPSEAEKIEAAISPLLSPPKTEDKPVFLPEGKSILLYGGAAAVAILAVAVGMVVALRKK